MRRAIVVLLFQLFSSHLVAAAPLQDAEPQKLHFAMPAEAHFLLQESSRFFKARLQETTGAEVALEVIPLKTVRQTREALDAGTIDIAVLPATSFSIAVGPYVAGSDIAGTRRRQSSEVGAYELAQLDSDYALVGITFWNAPAPPIVTVESISGLDELRGKKIRAFGARQQILKEFGATEPGPREGIGFGPLRRGQVDGVELPPGKDSADLRKNMGAESVTTDLSATVEYVFVVRKNFWYSLRYRTQAEIAAAARAAAQHSDQVAQAETRAMLSKLRAQDIELMRFSAAEKARIKRAALAAWANRADARSTEVLERAFAVTFRKPKVVWKAGRPAASEARRAVLFATIRAIEPESEIPYRFGNRMRDEGPNYGSASVSLKAGRQLRDDLDKAATVASLQHFSSNWGFKTALREAARSNEHVLIFVHGYNNSFPDAVRRAAQFAVDADFTGPVVVFSWPSDGTALLYFHDEARVGGARSGFAQLIKAVESVLPRSRINILAHSMGSRVLLDYTETLAEGLNDAKKGKYESLTFVAPDTTIEVLRLQKDFLPDIAETTTVYFSKEDRALWLSTQLHQGPRRLGNMIPENLFRHRESVPLRTSSLEFVDAHQIDSEFFTFSPRHGYVFEEARGVADAAALLVQGLDATRRSAENPTVLSVMDNDGGMFWTLNP